MFDDIKIIFILAKFGKFEHIIIEIKIYMSLSITYNLKTKEMKSLKRFYDQSSMLQLHNILFSVIITS